MFFRSDVRQGRGRHSEYTVNQRHLSPSFVHTHSSPHGCHVTDLKREEHLHFSSPVSPDSHADSRDSDCGCLRVSTTVRVCLCVCVCVRLWICIRLRHAYLPTSTSCLHISMCMFWLLSPLAQKQGACVRVFIVWHVLSFVKTGCSLAKHLCAVRHGAYNRQKRCILSTGCVPAESLRAEENTWENQKSSARF